jgi:PAS domain S-box-containing protein
MGTSSSEKPDGGKLNARIREQPDPIDSSFAADDLSNEHVESFEQSAIRIASIYLVIGVLWILLSDKIAAEIAPTQKMLTQIALYKGWAYVFITAVLLYWLIQRETAALRRSEAQLRYSETQMRLVTDSIPAQIAYIDADRCYRFTNRASQEWLGHSSTELEGQHIENFWEAETINIVSPYIEAALAGFTVTYESKRSNYKGETHEMQSTYVPDKREDGTVIGFYALMNDVTSLKQAEAEREQLAAENRSQRALLSAILEADPGGLAVLSGDEMRVIYANPAFRYIIPALGEEPLGRLYTEIWPPEAGNGYHDQIAHVLETGNGFQSDPFERVYPDGDRLIFTLQARRITWNNQPACVLNFWDMTEQETARRSLAHELVLREEAEATLQTRNQEIQAMTQQLWHTARLATMGELAASLAHELNNPLAILSLRVEDLDSQLAGDLPARHNLSVMQEEIDRMAGLVANLLQFSRSSQQQISSLDLREEIEQTLELMRDYLIHRKIRLQREFEPEIPLVMADRQQMRQLFMNLFTNASDAMPGGGTLTIRIQSRDGQVEVDVQDTGIGIAPEDAAQIMEPFFTTKPEGKGTGLGLSICRRIMKEHHGSIEITSPGRNQGATVKICLPVSRK